MALAKVPVKNLTSSDRSESVPGIAESACRDGCGACCIAPSISSPIPGMPGGKPAGEPCLHLTPERRCALFGRPERPAVCGGFRPMPEVCGSDAADALRLIGQLEADTAR